MKFSENDRDFERAYDILELPPNASREAVEQAHRDLREVWNPERFQDDDRLKRRAEEQLARIEEAYELLKDHHARQDPLLQELYGKTRKGRTPSHPPLKKDPHTPVIPPSLLDSVFNGSASRSTKRFPLALVVVGIVIIVVLAFVFTGRRGGGPVPANPGDNAPSAATRTPLDQPTAPPVSQEPPAETDETTSPAPTGGSDTSEEPPAPLANRRQPPQPQQSSTPARPNRESKPVKEGAPAPSATRAIPAPRPGPDTKPELVRGPEEGGVAPEEERRVLNVLGQKSQTAQNILDGNTSEFRVMSWRVTKKDGGEFWAHIVAQSATGGTTHLIWAVDPAKETIRPMSQSARDLDKVTSGNSSAGS